MAAGTTNKAAVNAYTLKNLAKQHTRKQKSPNDEPIGYKVYDTGSQTVATTNIDDANDELFVFTFPPKTYLLDLLVDFSDLDTHATPTLQVDVISETSGGTETVLISNSTAPQSGAVDELDAGLRFTDVSNQKLGFKVDTGAATAAAGTVRFIAAVWHGDLITVS